LLVENRQLHRDAREVLEALRRFARVFVFVLVIQVNEDVPVYAVGGEEN
jgi:hypothetical protein